MIKEDADGTGGLESSQRCDGKEEKMANVFLS